MIHEMLHQAAKQPTINSQLGEYKGTKLSAVESQHEEYRGTKLSAVNLQAQAFDKDEESSLDDLQLDYNERMEEMEEESRLECDQDGCHQPKNAKPNAPMLTKLG